MKELISVIVPLYNVEKYLERCIDSIINQTYDNLEIILVDDGSTDRSGLICDQYKEQDTRIKVIHKKNGGASSARNQGMSIAKGSYIGFIDSDDYIAPDMYESLYQHMKEGVDIVSCALLNISLRDKAVLYGTDDAITLKTEEALHELLINRILSFSACNKLFKKEAIDHLSFPEGKVGEDLPFIYQAIKDCKKIVHTGKVKYFCCYRKDSVSRRDYTRKRMDFIFFTRDIYRDVTQNYPQLIKSAERCYLRNIVYVIIQIEDCLDKERYMYDLMRLKQVLRHMVLQILFNPYMDKGLKLLCLKEMR